MINIEIKLKQQNNTWKIKIFVYYKLFLMHSLIGWLVGLCLFLSTPWFGEVINKNWVHQSGEINFEINDSGASAEKLKPEIILFNDHELKIKEAVVVGNYWNVYEEEVAWLNNSGDLNSGNIVIYGHNYSEFGNIKKLNIGDVIKIKSNGAEKDFVVKKTFETTPEDLSAVNNEEDLLTMYTCSGWMDTKRYFVVAEENKIIF